MNGYIASALIGLSNVIVGFILVWLTSSRRSKSRSR